MRACIIPSTFVNTVILSTQCIIWPLLTCPKRKYIIYYILTPVVFPPRC